LRFLLSGQSERESYSVLNVLLKKLQKGGKKNEKENNVLDFGFVRFCGRVYRVCHVWRKRGNAKFFQRR